MQGVLVNALIELWQKYDLPFVSPNMPVDEHFYQRLPKINKAMRG